MSDKKKETFRGPQGLTTIHLKNSYFEGIVAPGPNGQARLAPAFQSLLDKNIFPGEFKPRYWLGRVFDKIIQEANAYQKIKGKLIREHTKKYDKDEGAHKKGDPIFLENGQPDWIDAKKFAAEFTELQEIEVDLGIRPIEFDAEKGPDAVGKEMILLIPLLEEPGEKK